MNTFLKTSLLSLAITALAACGGTSTQDGNNRSSASSEGRITINGGLAGATIFVDMNDSGSHDDDEPIGYTDSQGFFGYNPIIRVNYCRSDDPQLRQHCLRLPSLSNMPDEVTVFYYGGVDLLTGEQNDVVYRYHVQVDALRDRSLDLDGALAMVSAIADSDDGLDILYAIIDAFYQVNIGDSAPLMLTPRARALNGDDMLDTQAKFDALVAAGIFQGLGDDTVIDDNMTRANIADLLSRLLGQPPEPPSNASFPDLDAFHWSAGYLAESKGFLLSGHTGGPFDRGGQVSLEELAILLTKSLLGDVTPTDPDNIGQWAQDYIAAAIQIGVMPPLNDYTTPAERAQLVDAAYFVYEQKQPEVPPQTNAPLYKALQIFVTQLLQDDALNDSFSNQDFDLLLASLAGLSGEAHDAGQRINLARLVDFLLDIDRDLPGIDLGDFLLEPDFFDATLSTLVGQVIDIHYDDPAKGNGRAQFLLTPTSASAPLDGGSLQACVRYQEQGVLPQNQLFADPLYLSGRWSRLNDNSLLLSLNLLPGMPYSRVLQLDWAQVQSGNDLASIRFDLTDRLEAWEVDLLAVDSTWQTLGNHAQADNASCAVLLAD